ncbi:hypothetical protein [Ornithinimicrobium flavum]|uniref:hypothetical protein n=1 Tax=Ornithinimicrobium flavum TaxID=1288636 RepID=UPI00106F4FF2|nr:hypothetical protein [Ornithinimicrobium flavum]
MEWADISVSLSTLVLGGLAGHFSGGRQARQSEARAARRGSALELRTALRELRDVVRRWGTSPAATDDDVRSALTEWNRVLDFHRHRVPNDLMRALASVKFAAGEVFGPTVMAYVLPEFEEARLAERDDRWQDMLVDYAGYLMAQLGRWEDGQPRAATDTQDFDTWRHHGSEALGDGV